MARNEGSTGPKRLDDTRCSLSALGQETYPGVSKLGQETVLLHLRPRDLSRGITRTSTSILDNRGPTFPLRRSTVNFRLGGYVPRSYDAA